jgi:hypothetical protein
MLHPKAELLHVLPFIGLLTGIHHEQGVLWSRGTSKANPPGTPILELLLCALLDALNKHLRYHD